MESSRRHSLSFMLCNSGRKRNKNRSICMFFLRHLHSPHPSPIRTTNIMYSQLSAPTGERKIEKTKTSPSCKLQKEHCRDLQLDLKCSLFPPLLIFPSVCDFRVLSYLFMRRVQSATGSESKCTRAVRVSS